MRIPVNKGGTNKLLQKGPKVGNQAKKDTAYIVARCL